jgi:hypothetical protein
MIFESTFPLLEKVEQNRLYGGDEGCVVDQNPLLEKVEQIHFWESGAKSIVRGLRRLCPCGAKMYKGVVIVDQK